MILNSQIKFAHLSVSFSILVCFLMALFYVVSLYLWSNQYRFNRNTLDVIKRRFVSVILSCLVSAIFVYLISQNGDKHTLVEWIGLKFDAHLVLTIAVALGLTTTLFMGPIAQYFLGSYQFNLHNRIYIYEMSMHSKATNGNVMPIASPVPFVYSYLDHLKEMTRPSLLLEDARRNVKNLFFWRNYLISPFTEEFVFRGCMLPLLVSHFKLVECILITPLFFGLAHLHHIIEGYKVNKQPLGRLILQHMFQFVYTYIFGAYSSYLFLRTGNIFASFASHSFCNLMGFPNIGELLNDFSGRARTTLISLYVIGFVLFFVALSPSTNPSYFNNKVYSTLL